MLSAAEILELYSSKRSDKSGCSRKVYHLSDEVVIKIPDFRYAFQSISELEFYTKILQEEDKWAFAKLIDYVELPNSLFKEIDCKHLIIPILFFERLILFGDNSYYDDNYEVNDIIRDIYHDKAKDYAKKIVNVCIKYGLHDIIEHLPNWGVDYKGDLKILDVGYWGTSKESSINEYSYFIDDFDLWDSYLLLSQRKYFEKSSS